MIDSWVNRGTNKNVAPDQVSVALGRDVVDQLSLRTGLSRDEVVTELARMLPNVVDKLTPEGRLPTQAGDNAANVLPYTVPTEFSQERVLHGDHCLDCVGSDRGLHRQQDLCRLRPGPLLDIVLGIVGAVVGGYLFSALGSTGITGFNIWSMIVAIIGAVIVLWLYHMITARG